MTGVQPLGPVFISYRQSDGTELAVELAWALRAAGVPVWHDQTDLPPGDTSERLREALASGLSGAVLVVTADIVHSAVVREVELPRLLELADDPAFTLLIVSTVMTARSSLDYAAPDRLLGTTEGTLAGLNQRPVSTSQQRADAARSLARRRVELLRSDIAMKSGCLTIDLQTRIPPYAARNDAHLVVRLRPPPDGQRRPSAEAFADLQSFLYRLPQLISVGGASSIRVRGGAHLSVACAFGAALPTTLVGTVEVVDVSGTSWLLKGQAPSPGSTPLLGSVASGAARVERGPVVVYVDLLPQRSDAAFQELQQSLEFSGVLHLRPMDGGLLDPALASELVGEVTAAVRRLAGEHGTTVVHLLLRCPYPIALLVGRTLNTLTVHLYEWDDADEESGPRYLPSVVLRSGAGGSPIHQVFGTDVGRADPTD